MKPCSLERTLQLDVSNSIDRIDAKRRCEPQSLKASKLNSTWPNHDLTKISIFSLEYLKRKINFSFNSFKVTARWRFYCFENFKYLIYERQD